MIGTPITPTEWMTLALALTAIAFVVALVWFVMDGKGDI
jgi:hypothetical protein